MSLKPASERNPYLLPDNVAPELYRIHLQPNEDMTILRGFESIDLQITKKTNVIVLHVVEIDLDEVNIIRLHPVRLCPVGMSEPFVEINKELQIATLTFDEPIDIGHATLHIGFHSKINDTKMRGAYRTKYSADGKDYIGVATQCEPTDARRIFPCFDQPDMKAHFKLDLTVPNNLTALANAPILARLPEGDNKSQILFEETPKMSSYLFAFVAGNYRCIQAEDKNGIAIKVWATPGKEEWGRFALECALHTLPFYQEKYGMPYPITKLDLIALPDFEAGAMENLGLVTFRETALLIDPNNNSIAARQRVAEVVDHELAHMWFGDIVTMKWWNDLWLNEGFATFMANVAMDHQFPEWDIWTQFYNEETLRAFEEDALLSSKPIQVDVKNPNEINESFGAIAYSKGASVIRMLEHSLGADVFYKGLKLYLQRHAYGNARTSDLWQALEDVSGEPIRQVMASFTEQPGYPLVCVKRTQRGTVSFIDLEQKRFIDDGTPDPNNMLWNIPIEIAKETGEHDTMFLLNPTFVGKEEPVSSGWIKLNLGQSGYYRTAYSPDLLEELMRAVRLNALSTVDCLGLLNDVTALARAGYIKTSQMLMLLQAYTNNHDHNVWENILSPVQNVRNLLAQQKIGNYYAKLINMFGRGLAHYMAERVGWDKKPTDTDRDILLRLVLLGGLSNFDDALVAGLALASFEAMIGGNEIDPDIKQTVYNSVAQNGDAARLGQLLNIYRKTDDHQEKQRVLRSLGRFRDKKTINAVLAFAISSEVRKQDVFMPIVHLGANTVARPLVWSFVKEHWKLLTEWFEDGHMMGRIVEGPTSGFATLEALADVEEFFESHPVASAQRAMKRSVECIRSNIKWIERDTHDIISFFEGKEL